jgi:hypothetical protein
MFEFLGGVIKAARERASALVVGLSLAVVAASTGFISYTHISALTITENQSWKTAHLMPLTVDGQIAIGSVILMEVKGKGRWWGLVGFLPGLVESLLANWASGWAAHPAVMQGHQVIVAAVQGHNLGAALWSTVPAQAFACSTFLFEMWLRYRRRVQGDAKPSVASVLAAAPLAMARIAAELLPQAPEPAAPGPEPEVTACRDLSRALTLSPRPEGAPWGLVSPAAAPEPAQLPRFAIPVVGPSMGLSQRPAAKPRGVKAVGDDRLPLPEGRDELRRVLASMSRNEIWRTYQVSKHKADQLLKALADGNLEEVA